MEKIELNPLDKKDLLELLEYAKKKHNEEEPSGKGHWNDAAWWETRIEQLKMVLNGYVSNSSYIQSSYTTIDKQMSAKEKRKWKYRQSVSNDLNDLMDYFEEKKDSEELF